MEIRLEFTPTHNRHRTGGTSSYIDVVMSCRTEIAPTHKLTLCNLHLNLHFSDSYSTTYAVLAHVDARGRRRLSFKKLVVANDFRP
jgi:hypothetical protein